MLNRAWFVFSLIWFALMFWSYDSAGNMDGGHLAFAVAPFFLGAICRGCFRYIRNGTLRRID